MKTLFLTTILLFGACGGTAGSAGPKGDPGDPGTMGAQGPAGMTGPAGDSKFVDGTRLRVVSTTSADGLRVPEPGVYFDTKFNVTCTSVDLMGTKYCVPGPQVISNGNECALKWGATCYSVVAMTPTFIDSNCMQASPLIVFKSCGGAFAADEYFHDYVFNACGTLPTLKVYKVRDTAPSFWQLNGSNQCVPFNPVNASNWRYYDEVALSEFATIGESHP